MNSGRSLCRFSFFLFLHEMIVKNNEMIVLCSRSAASLCKAAGFYGVDLNSFNDACISGCLLSKMEEYLRLLSQAL